MHLHKRFTTEQVGAILKGYQRGELTGAAARELLEVKSTAFFALWRRYREAPATFALTYQRHSPKKLTAAVEQKIKQALRADQRLIDDPDMPVWTGLAHKRGNPLAPRKDVFDDLPASHYPCTTEELPLSGG